MPDLDPVMIVPVETDSGALTVTVEPGKPILIFGANGTGKSALMHHFRTVVQQSRPMVYIPGSRTATFDNEESNITAAGSKQMADSISSWDSSADTRWKLNGGNQRNDKALHDFQTAEIDYFMNFVPDLEVPGNASSALSQIQTRNSPSSKANRLFAQAGLPVRIRRDGSVLKVERDEQLFNVPRMPDGERSTLLLIAQVVIATPGTIFLLDEPELHLHRSIIVPLIRAVVSQRNDCAFVISTHELGISEGLPEASCLLVRGCSWSKIAGNLSATVNRWQVDLLPPNEELPEDLRRDIIGARAKILFVEGTETSLDQPLYQLLFPNASIRAKGGCLEVERAVKGLRSAQTQHHVAAYGIVDGDGLTTARTTALEAASIFALQVHSIESLYYCREAIQAVAEAVANRIVAPVEDQPQPFAVEASELIADAYARAIKSLSSHLVEVDLASRVALQRLQESVMIDMPERDELPNHGTVMNLPVSNPYAELLQELKDAISQGNLDSIIARFPVRHSQALTEIAKGLKLKDRNEYDRLLLAEVENNVQLADALRAKLAPLVPLLNPVVQPSSESPVI